ncbi:MAG: hypothetical protein ABR521_01855 [Gaiellaceae bacterium]
MGDVIVNEHEVAFARFLKTGSSSRYVQLSKTPRGREKWVQGLAHFDPSNLEERFARPLPDAARTAATVAALLERRGAPEVCWVMSEDRDFDASELPLRDALDEFHGRLCGVVLSCVPGRLAYLETEDMHRFILERPT